MGAVTSYNRGRQPALVSLRAACWQKQTLRCRSHGKLGGVPQAVADRLVDVAVEIGDDGPVVEAAAGFRRQQVLVLLELRHKAQPQVPCRHGKW